MKELWDLKVINYGGESEKLAKKLLRSKKTSIAFTIIKYIERLERSLIDKRNPKAPKAKSFAELVDKDFTFLGVDLLDINYRSMAKFDGSINKTLESFIFCQLVDFHFIY